MTEERYILMYDDCDKGWMPITTDENFKFIFPWFHSYEEAETAMFNFLKENAVEKDDDEDDPYSHYSHYFFILKVTEGHEYNGFCNISYDVRKAL